MTNTARIFIIDDEAPARKRLTNLLDDCRADFPLAIMGEAANGRDAIDALNKMDIDIVLCDIRMPIMDGIEFARHLATRETPPKLIFTTAFDQYAVKAFELNAVDYLLKPIKQERLLAALQKARVVKPPTADALATATNNKRRHLSIHERGKVVLVPLDDILYLKAELKYITVRTAAKNFCLKNRSPSSKKNSAIALPAFIAMPWSRRALSLASSARAWRRAMRTRRTMPATTRMAAGIGYA